ncbi:tripartite ATP-independent transporter solute receptor, DctP family [Tistlia consotensis]|uniref:Tripartite ATP-independent transporter solute receptor, DctP family n=1 Tax=Tistlia consotensis USBA 355 TaxID=560819 RepID=A0A1Y6BHZ6_9PROT|nr:DctP family TRAP transporter solute-binding subunit [Tistlia consotensis]SMF02296.1 tripartite ATP-independent transporter solute receptor, DctP family [Tistlia consotensis USBA 355]SNS26670.1 tripartite ATP-independent transporter solute receptor, DctP family [Tistlia consotensis]
MIGSRSLLLAAATAAALTASGSGLAAAQTTIKFAHVDPADWTSSKKGAASEIFKNLVESESGGRIKVELYPAGQLGGEKELVAQAQSGAIQMTMVSGVYGSFCKEASILDTPYLFASAPVAWKVLDGPFGRKLAEHCLKKTALRTLAYGETGFRDFTNNKHEIRSPADVKGLKLRVQEIPLYVEMVKGLGGIPTPVAWPETPGALKTGVVDGQENPVSVILGNKFYEFQKYLTLDQHVYGTDFVLVNEAFFQGLSDEDKAMLKRDAIIAGNVGRSIQQFNSAAGVAELQKHGMVVYKPTSAELEAFRKAAQPPVLAYLKSQVEPGWLDDLEAAVADAEASLAN